MSAMAAVSGADVSLGTYSGASSAPPGPNPSPSVNPNPAPDSPSAAPVADSAPVEATPPAVTSVTVLAGAEVRYSSSSVTSSSSASSASAASAAAPTYTTTSTGTISAANVLSSYIPSAWQTAGAAYGASMPSASLTSRALRSGLASLSPTYPSTTTYPAGPATTSSLNTNVMALNAYRYLGSAQDLLADSLSRLSTGNRIRSASDDAAGLAIAEGMKSQILGSQQAVRNAQDGLSLVQTAEGVLGTVTDMLQRMRTLAVQGAADSYGAPGRDMIAREMDAIRQEIGRIGEVTEALGRHILGGRYTEPADALRFQLGPNASDSDVVALTFVNVVDIAKQQLSYVPQSAANSDAFGAVLEGIDAHLGVILGARSDLGAVSARFRSTIDSLNVAVENLSASSDRLRGADFGREAQRFARGRILSQSSAAMLSHATRGPRGVLALLITQRA